MYNLTKSFNKTNGSKLVQVLNGVVSKWDRFKWRRFIHFIPYILEVASLRQSNPLESR